MNLLEEMEAVCFALEEIFGWQYFQHQSESLKKQDPDGIGLGRSILPFEQQSLGYLWLKTKEELIMGQLNGVYQPGYAAKRLQALGRDLLAGKNKFDWKPLLSKLDQDFETGAFLVHWIRRLLEIGYTVEIKGELLLKTEDFFWQGVNCQEKNWLDILAGCSGEVWSFNFQTDRILDFEQEFWSEKVESQLAAAPGLKAVILSQGQLDSAAFRRMEKIWFQNKNYFACKQGNEK